MTRWISLYCYWHDACGFWSFLLQQAYGTSRFIYHRFKNHLLSTYFGFIPILQSDFSYDASMQWYRQLYHRPLSLKCKGCHGIIDVYDTIKCSLSHHLMCPRSLRPLLLPFTGIICPILSFQWLPAAWSIWKQVIHCMASFLLNDVDPADTIYLTGASALFSGAHIASFPSASGVSPVQSTFNFTATCEDISNNAYRVTFNVTIVMPVPPSSSIYT